MIFTSIVFTPILFAHSSTFLNLFFIKSFSNVSNKSTDHKPNILCLLLFDLTKYKEPSFSLIFFLYSSIIDISKRVCQMEKLQSIDMVFFFL